MLQMDETSSDVVSNTFDIDESPVDLFLAEEGLAEADATGSFAPVKGAFENVFFASEDDCWRETVFFVVDTLGTNAQPC